MRSLGFFIIIGCLSSYGELVPSLALKELAAKSDLIASGTVVNSNAVRQVVITIAANSVPATEYKAELQVSNVIKGSADRTSFYFYIPAHGMGYRGIGNQSQGLFFLLKDAEGNLHPTDPYHPFLDSVDCESAMKQTDPFERILRCILRLATRPTATVDLRTQALRWLDLANPPSKILEGLKPLLKDPSPSISLRAAAILCAHGDESVLEPAVEIVERQAAAADQLTARILGLALRSVKQPRSVPFLAQFLARGSPVMRQGAAVGLRNVGVQAGIPPLILALDDSDHQVRFLAILGLVQLSGDYSWSPTEEDFQSDESKYLSHWKSWGKHWMSNIS
jgi:hypothetical protein